MTRPSGTLLKCTLSVNATNTKTRFSTISSKPFSFLSEKTNSRCSRKITRLESARAHARRCGAGTAGETEVLLLHGPFVPLLPHDPSHALLPRPRSFCTLLRKPTLRYNHPSGVTHPRCLEITVSSCVQRLLLRGAATPFMRACLVASMCYARLRGLDLSKANLRRRWPGLVFLTSNVLFVTAPWYVELVYRVSATRSRLTNFGYNLVCKAVRVIGLKEK